MGVTLSLVAALLIVGQPTFDPRDVFDLEYASDPQISPDGTKIVYTRRSADIMTDQFRASLWMLDGQTHRALVQGTGAYRAARWSPSGDRVLYVATDDGRTELRVLWMDSLQSMALAQLPASPGSVVWARDGRRIAFTMFVEREQQPSPAKLPAKPEGAKWADPARIVDGVTYRTDGGGYVKAGNTHVFVLDASGGTPRQLTRRDVNHGSVSWDVRGRSLIVSTNLSDDWEYESQESDLYELHLDDGRLERLTDRVGPDEDPVVSPDGHRIAYLGHDEHYQGFQVTRLHVLDRRSGEISVLGDQLDRSVQSPRWAADGSAIYAMYVDQGISRIGRFTFDGEVAEVASHIGGTTLGRPYASGSFSLAADQRIATVITTPKRPGDVALVDHKGVRRLTNLNEDLLGHKDIRSVEELWVESSADGLPIQAWVMTPPEFDASARYPMVLEIHGGPFANYGPRFSAEAQLFAAAGYIVVYANPRGSTSYGQTFGNMIHHAYPGEDYDDLISVVDGALDRYPIDPERLFVTGGSGGGVLTAWIVGKTDRFRAAVVAKPVINWTSFALTADYYTFFWRYWFPGPPWDHPEHYWQRSPLSLVGNVTTPTMLLTGEEDFRTPMSETEQYYQALKIRRIPTRMVRIPGASHGIASRPSRLIAKVANILEWFDEHSGLPGDSQGSDQDRSRSAQADED